MTEHDRARLVTTRRVALAGPVVGIVLAAGTAIAGAGGRLGLALLLVCGAAGCVAAALVTLVQAAFDEARRQPVALRRVGWAAVLVLMALVLIVLVAGVVAGAEG